MKTFVKIAAIGAVLGMAACSRPAQQGALVNDPYAGAGGGVGSADCMRRRARLIRAQIR